MISFSSRLTLFFTLLITVMLTALGLLIQHSAEQRFAQQNARILEQQLDALTARVENLQANGDWALVGQITHTAPGLGRTISTRVETAAGDTLFSDRSFSSPFDASALLDHPGEVQQQRWQENGVHYQGAALALQEPKNLILTLALDVNGQDDFLQFLSNRMLEVMLWVILGGSFLAWWLIRLGLRPPSKIGADIRNITIDKLDHRIPLDTVPLELHDLVRERNRMFARLQESFTRLTNFSSDIAHELRTPISNLTTQIQVSLSKPRPAEEYREILASSLEELDKLSRIISDMLFLAKTENGMELPSRETFALEEEVSKVCEFYDMLAEERDIRLRARGSGTLSGNRMMLDRAICNLLSNGIRHTHQGGSVDVEISSDAEAVTLRITNTGDEIPAADIPYLFDRFYRVDQARCHADNECTGLGLSITQAIVKAHDGSINVTSDKGETCFTLTFPAAG